MKLKLYALTIIFAALIFHFQADVFANERAVIAQNGDIYRRVYTEDGYEDRAIGNLAELGILCGNAETANPDANTEDAEPTPTSTDLPAVRKPSDNKPTTPTSRPTEEHFPDADSEKLPEEIVKSTVGLEMEERLQADAVQTDEQLNASAEPADINSEKPKDGKTEEVKIEDGKTEETKPEDEKPKEVKSEDGETEDEKSEVKDGEHQNHRLGFFLGAGAAVVLLAVFAVWILKRKNDDRRKIQRTYQPDIPVDADSIIISYLSGGKKGCIDVLPYKEWYIIGTSSDCDLVIEGLNIAERHAKISENNGRFYLEDLDTDDGTYLNGMRLYSANRLRKGSVITIGTISFVISF